MDQTNPPKESTIPEDPCQKYAKTFDDCVLRFSRYHKKCKRFSISFMKCRAEQNFRYEESFEGSDSQKIYDFQTVEEENLAVFNEINERMNRIREKINNRDSGN